MGQTECILYGTSHCHLCEQAEQVLVPFVQRRLCTVELVDIADQDDLLGNFGTLIPVLFHSASQQQLNWPFDEPSVADFLHHCVATA